MPAVQISQNHPGTLPFVEAIGKLIVNLGLLEAMTYEYIHTLQSDEQLSVYAKRLGLKDRIDMVCDLVKSRAPLSEAVKASLIDDWKLLRPHMELRNVVAHNPIMFAVTPGEAGANLQSIGVLNMKPKDRTRDAELVSLAEINGSVNAVASIAPRIDGAYREIVKSARELASNKSLERTREV